jgi:glycosyltransferase involved in cell wall biosynthesis
MKILFVVDGRSPIALNWISYFVETGHDVHLVSLYPCQPDLALASLTVIPVAFSSAVEAGNVAKAESSLKSRIIRKLASPRVRTWLRHHFVPRSLPKAAAKFQDLIAVLQPDLIHAMRVPYEGMLAALACASLGSASPPLLVSIWGNDFTLHAPATRRLTDLTRLTMRQADALHTDCQRDFQLAQHWGFEASRPGVVLPGAGGIQSDIFYPGDAPRQSVVINPRGLRAYVQNDTFFKAIPLILEQQPQAQFLCPVMQGQPEAELWKSRLGAGDSLKLLPRLSRIEMAETFRQSQIVLSITTHDGTPNTLLEAMACGCFPIVGDIESLREWVQPGVNGFLVDPLDPEALAEAVLVGLSDPERRARARRFNTELIAEKAEFNSVMGQAQAFYYTLLQ